MNLLAIVLSGVLAADPAALTSGDHIRTLKMEEKTRTYLVHVPKSYDAAKPTPVVLVLHGAMMNGPMMAFFSGMSGKADQAGFVAVYPYGTGVGDTFLAFNAGGFKITPKDAPDDVAFVSKVLDELGTAINVDAKRVFATGMSNGGMMSYRLAAELSDRIAAIAPVGGTLAVDNCQPKRPVPVMHFHGTADTLVRYEGSDKNIRPWVTFKSVDDSVRTWAKLDGCPETPVTMQEPDRANDGMTVERKTYGPGKDGAEVILFTVKGGGHTWPGRDPILKFLGKSTKDISANDLIWEFFEKHPMRD